MDNIWDKFRKGDIDANNQELFFGTFIKGLVYDINQHISVRGENVPHFFLNTGDDIMYLEVKGVDQSKEPLQQTNEDFVYNKVPRCIITPSGINILTDQLTSPYTRGSFQVDYNDSLYQFTAEYRRLPFEMEMDFKYYFNSFTDVLECTQQICSKLAFINNFKFNYLGQTLNASYKIPDNIPNELNLQFDGGTTDSKYRSIALTLTVDGNLPIIRPQTITPADCVITGYQINTTLNGIEVR